MNVTKDEFQKCTNQIHKRVVHRDIAEHIVWIHSALFCETGYIKDEILFLGTKHRSWNLRKICTELVRCWSERFRHRPSDFQIH